MKVNRKGCFFNTRSLFFVSCVGICGGSFEAKIIGFLGYVGRDRCCVLVEI